MYVKWVPPNLYIDDRYFPTCFLFFLVIGRPHHVLPSVIGALVWRWVICFTLYNKSLVFRPISYDPSFTALCIFEENIYQPFVWHNSIQSCPCLKHLTLHSSVVLQYLQRPYRCKFSSAFVCLYFRLPLFFSFRTYKASLCLSSPPPPPPLRDYQQKHPVG